MAIALVTVPAAQASHSFTDVPDGHPFHTEIGVFKDTHITAGCTATTFCPDDFVKRQAMAAFIDRALGLVVRPGEAALRGVAGSRIAILDDGSSLVQTNAGGLELSHGGFRGLKLVGTATSPNLIGGHVNNAAGAGVVGATVAGGGYFSTPNRVLDDFGTVGGGQGNRVGDGAGTSSDRLYATIAGGTLNVASGGAATVAGGSNNTASGLDASVPGGRLNTAGGDYSFAAGRRAKATHMGSFVLADSTDLDIGSNADNSFTVRARGGARFISAINATTGAPTAGVTLAAGGGSWSSLSDRAAKRDFRPLDRRTLLRKLARLPISSWSYRSQPASIRHVGPTAQDFRRAFGVGEDARHITTIDADGVALAAIQALDRENREMRRQLRRQQREIAILKRKTGRLAALERQVARLVRAAKEGEKR